MHVPTIYSAKNQEMNRTAIQLQSLYGAAFWNDLLKQYITNNIIKNAGNRFQGQNQPTQSVSFVSAVISVEVYSSSIPSRTQKITASE